jgi:putative ABC transport system ATP-binding protein
MEPKMAVDNLTRVAFQRDDNGTREVPLLKSVSFSVARGEILAVIGPSGAGKTCLLRMLNALEEPTSGTIFLDGRDIATLDPLDLRRRVGMVFQTPCSLGETVRENLAYGLGLRPGKQERSIGEAGVAYLEMVGLGEGFLSRAMKNLSAGEQQRVTVARALTVAPEVLLLDEPTSALDPTATRDLLELIRRLRDEQGITVVFVSHALEQAKILGDRIVLLVRGEKVEEGPAERFFRSPETEVGRRFIRGELR